MYVVVDGQMYDVDKYPAEILWKVLYIYLVVDRYI